MKDIQYNKNLSQEQWEQYHVISITDIGLSVRTHNVMRRAGYHTLGDLIDATSSEILEAIALTKVKEDRKYSKRALKEIQENIALKGLRLLTDEEKHNVINALTEIEKLQRDILILKNEKDIAESRCMYAEERLERLSREKKNKDERAVCRIAQITKTN